MPKPPKPKTADVIALLKSIIGDAVDLEDELNSQDLSRFANQVLGIRRNLVRAVKMLSEEIDTPKGGK
jgi:hypothetical protein